VISGLQSSLAQPGKVYQHYKGDCYLVLFLSEESTNARCGMAVVVYLSLERGIIHNRDLGEWVELVKWPDGEMRPRFV
jgi:hypothetical protein